MREFHGGALHWLEEAHVHHDPGLIWIRRDPLSRALAPDERYRKLLKDIKLSE